MVYPGVFKLKIKNRA